MRGSGNRWRGGRAAAASAACVLLALSANGAFAQQQPVEPEVVIARGSADAQPAAGSEATSRKAITEIPVWKRITLGTYKGPNAVRNAFDAARMHIGDTADEILGRPAFPFSRTKIELDLVVVTAADLGFPMGATPVAEIYGRAMQFGLELCPAEVGPQLRLQYVNQPVGEFLHIAMVPIATYHGNPVDLTVGNGGAGLLLVGGDASPDLMLHSKVKFVFVRPARVAMPNIR
jgi:hypothetical protein